MKGVVEPFLIFLTPACHLALFSKSCCEVCLFVEVSQSDEAIVVVIQILNKVFHFEGGEAASCNHHQEDLHASDVDDLLLLSRE
jgi:hypothetical protein